MVKPIISYGSSILTKVCNPVSNSVTAVDLIDTLKNTNGVGLAAPQIGLLEQIFITKLNNNTHRNFFKRLWVAYQVLQLVLQMVRNTALHFQQQTLYWCSL